MMIYNAICRWCQTLPDQHRSQVGVVMHTSCVNYKLESLRKLLVLGLHWIIPDNVYWELRLLEYSSYYCQEASFLLRHCVRGKTAAGNAWDLEQIYDTCKTDPVIPNQIYWGRLIFAFGDLNKQDEFLCHCRISPDCYVLVSPDWNHFNQNISVASLSDVKNHSFRHSRPLPAGVHAPKLKQIPSIIYRGSQKGILSGAHFQRSKDSGAAAIICTSDIFPHRLVKIYREKAQVGNYVRKLEGMQQFSYSLPPFPAAFPRTILYTPQGEILGYTMKICGEVPVQRIVFDRCDAYDRKAIIKNLALLLLELHNLQIMVNDLSYNNIMVDSQNKVYLVDCDSFQFFDFPGGPVTEIYCHPEVENDTSFSVLRQPRHEYFAFAVLAFQCRFKEDHPLRQKMTRNTTWSWRNHRFPLQVGSAAGLNVNENTKLVWQQLSPELQQLFVDEFTFQRDHSIGAWIRTMELLQ